MLKNELRARELRRDFIVKGLLRLDRSSVRIPRVLVPDENFLVSSVIKSGED